MKVNQDIEPTGQHFHEVDRSDPQYRFNDGVRKLVKQFARALNGAVGFGDATNQDNIDGAWSGNIVTPSVPGTNFVVEHKLGRIPVGYWVMRKDRAVDVYDGTTTWDNQNISFRASVGDANVNIFII